MAENSRIEWTDHTFNPWTGCTKVSPGCDHCYAEGWAKRSGTVQWGDAPRRRTTAVNWRLPLKWNAQAAAAGRRFRVFCASLADVFDNQVDPAWRHDLFNLIRDTPHLDWQLLTKRIGNVPRMIAEAGCVAGNGFRYVPNNVQLGATITNQAEADRDIPKLIAAKHEFGIRVAFLSLEPLLGPVSLRWLAAWPERTDGRGAEHPSGRTDHLDGLRRLDWVIVGGESGPGARPMHPSWPQTLRDQCKEGGVPFLFKQWGEWRPICQGDGDWYDPLYRSNRVARAGEDQGALDDLWGRTCTVPQLILHRDGQHRQPLEPMAFAAGTGAVQAFRVGKKGAGRDLDGQTHDGFPAGVPEVCKPSPTCPTCRRPSHLGRCADASRADASGVPSFQPLSRADAVRIAQEVGMLGDVVLNGPSLVRFAERVRATDGVQEDGNG